MPGGEAIIRLATLARPGVGGGAPRRRGDVHETLLEGAARECLEETGHRFVAAGLASLYVGEQFFCWRQTDPADPGLRYWHTLAVVFAGTVEGEPEPAWTPDPREVRRARWVDPADLTPETTRPDHWAALRRAGLV
jgi:8-oxo-dGTP pyrophosphatase MutT (NUDIX family)